MGMGKCRRRPRRRPRRRRPVGRRRPRLRRGAGPLNIFRTEFFEHLSGVIRGYKGVGLEGGSACDFHFDGGWRMTGSAPRGTVWRKPAGWVIFRVL